MTINQYVYFISFVRPYGTGGFQFGNGEFILDRPIKNFKTIQEVENYIALESDVELLTILNYELLDSYNKEERRKKNESDA